MSMIHMRTRDKVIVISIVIVLVLGVVAFFFFLPKEAITVSNFIAYMASLSAMVLVLLHILTTSTQLDAMQRQIREMEYTRNLQIQPFPYVTSLQSEIERPRFYHCPIREIKKDYGKAKLLYRVRFNARIENIGNGPAINIDVIARLTLEHRDGKFTPIMWSGELIECISVREKDVREIDFVFQGDDQAGLEVLSRGGSRVHLDLTILYKNTLGADFKVEARYSLRCDNEEERRNLERYLNVLRTAPVDYETQIKRYESLMKQDKWKEASEFFLTAFHKFWEKSDLAERVVLTSMLEPYAFSVIPLNKEEYQKEIRKQPPPPWE